MFDLPRSVSRPVAPSLPLACCSWRTRPPTTIDPALYVVVGVALIFSGHTDCVRISRSRSRSCRAPKTCGISPKGLGQNVTIGFLKRLAARLPPRPARRYDLVSEAIVEPFGGGVGRGGSRTDADAASSSTGGEESESPRRLQRPTDCTTRRDSSLIDWVGDLHRVSTTMVNDTSSLSTPKIGSAPESRTGFGTLATCFARRSAHPRHDTARRGAGKHAVHAGLARWAPRRGTPPARALCP